MRQNFHHIPFPSRNPPNIQQGEQETRGAGEGRKKTVGNRCEEICGRERDGAEHTGQTRWTQQELSGPHMTGTFRKESRDFEGGGFGMD